MAAHGTVRIGISGWTYAGWRGVFYPGKLPHNRELAFAAQNFPTVEINGTFYSLQRPTSFARWAAETPDDFAFAIKGSRFITHMKKLRGIRTALANFFASGMLQLDGKLGPFLWQFPPQFQFRADLLDEFFTLLPRDTFAAAELASEHDARLRGRSFVTPARKRPLRHAIEIRHPSCVAPEFIGLLRRQKIALVCADTVDWPRLMDVTADFVYVRLHGSKELYSSGYEDVDLDAWSQRVAAWARGGQPPAGATHPGVPPCEYASTAAPPKRRKRDVYVYFDNDAKVRAPFDAQGLIARVKHLLGE